MQNIADIRNVITVYNAINYCKARQNVLSLGWSNGVYYLKGIPISDDDFEKMNKFDNTSYEQRKSCVNNIDGKSNWYKNGKH